jgi:hypothetical protein
MNLKNRPDNLRGSSPVSDTHPTLVEMERLFLFVDGLVWSVCGRGEGGFSQRFVCKTQNVVEEEWRGHLWQ